jgi:hypothetical protein
MPRIFIVTSVVQIEAEYVEEDIVGEFAERHPRAWWLVCSEPPRFRN